jgi:hypothetical protein
MPAYPAQRVNVVPVEPAGLGPRTKRSMVMVFDRQPVGLLRSCPWTFSNRGCQGDALGIVARLMVLFEVRVRPRLSMALDGLSWPMWCSRSPGTGAHIPWIVLDFATVLARRSLGISASGENSGLCGVCQRLR